MLQSITIPGDDAPKDAPPIVLCGGHGIPPAIFTLVAEELWEML